MGTRSVLFPCAATSPCANGASAIWKASRHGDCATACSREDQNERLDEIADYLHATDAAGRAEDFAAIAARVRGFLEECGRSVGRRGGGNVLVVTHAMFIRALVFLFARDRVRTPAKIANASVTKVRWDDGAVTVETIGDVTHLGSRRG